MRCLVGPHGNYGPENRPSFSVADSLDRKEDVTHAIPVPQFSFGAEGLSANSAVIPAHAPGKSVTAKDLEVLLHKALDGASGDHVDSASGSGSGRELVTIPCLNHTSNNSRSKTAIDLGHWIVNLDEIQ